MTAGVSMHDAGAIDTHGTLDTADSVPLSMAIALKTKSNYITKQTNQPTVRKTSKASRSEF